MLCDPRSAIAAALALCVTLGGSAACGPLVAADDDTGASKSESYDPAKTRMDYWRQRWGFRRTYVNELKGIVAVDGRRCVKPGERYAINITDARGYWFALTITITGYDQECIGMRGPGCDWDKVSNYNLQSAMHDACTHVFGKEGSGLFEVNCGDEFGPLKRNEDCDLKGAVPATTPESQGDPITH